MPFVRKRKLKAITNSPPRSDGSNQRKLTRQAEPPPREAGQPRTLPRQDGEKHSRRIDPAQIIDGTKGSERPENLNCVYYIYSIYNRPF